MRRRTLIATGFILIALVAVGLPSTSHAAFDAYEMVGKALGLSKDQPQGGLGSVLKLAQEKLQKGDFAPTRRRSSCRNFRGSSRKPAAKTPASC